MSVYGRMLSTPSIEYGHDSIITSDSTASGNWNLAEQSFLDAAKFQSTKDRWHTVELLIGRRPDSPRDNNVYRFWSNIKDIMPRYGLENLLPLESLKFYQQE